jgi:hypothetical protein
MIAAMMTAANLGTRVTGWGFVIFTVGAIAWSGVALLTGQHSLLLSNGFLMVVDVVGIWRWLGRQARYETGASKAASRSRRAPVPTLFPASGMIGAPLLGQGDKRLGTIVDAMMKCDGAGISYVVVSQGGVAGVAETLRGIAPDRLAFSHGAVRTNLEEAAFHELPVLQPDSWPEGL